MPKLKQSKKLVIGLTGSFGSGKSTVAGMFKKSGSTVIDADKLAQTSISPGNPAYRKIKSIFGAGVLSGKRQVDRARLARAVFNNKNLLLRLNRIIHPEVIRIILRKIKAARPGMVILDAPLLIEAGLRNIVDKLIVVRASRNNQIKRIQRKFPIKKADILKRIKCQLSQKEKVRLADFVIDNDGSINETRKQVAELRRRLWKNWKSSI